jgi:hypothetical protein
MFSYRLALWYTECCHGWRPATKLLPDKPSIRAGGNLVAGAGCSKRLKTLRFEENTP